jgi:hypothetical protein
MTVLKTKDGRKNGERIQFPDMEEIVNLKGVVTHGQEFLTISLQLAFREPESERRGRWRREKGVITIPQTTQGY